MGAPLMQCPQALLTEYRCCQGFGYVPACLNMGLSMLFAGTFFATALCMRLLARGAWRGRCAPSCPSTTKTTAKWQVSNKLLIACAQGRTSLEMQEFDSLRDAVHHLQ